jgi:hypothetical protein
MQPTIVYWTYLPLDKPKNLTHVEIREAIEAAATEWNKCLADYVIFKEGRGDLQIRLAFDDKINRKNNPGRIGECRRFNQPRSWEISFDIREKWNMGGWRKLLGIGYDLRSTALHEFGHVIELPHADRYDFIMHKDYNEQIKLSAEESKKYRDFYKYVNDC